MTYEKKNRKFRKKVRRLEKTESTEDWKQILIELGCGDRLTEQIMEQLQTRDNGHAVMLLRRYRCTLLENLHTAERKVDLLDYLLYQLKRKNERMDMR